MNIKLELNDNTMPIAQLDLLIEILANQKVIMSYLAKINSSTDEEYDTNHEKLGEASSRVYSEIYQDLYVKYKSVNLNDILPNK